MHKSTERSISIEPIGNKYGKEIVDIILPIQQLEFNVPITLEDQPDLLDIEKNYQGSGGGFWGAKVDGRVVGTIGLINIGGKGGAIRKMFVRKEFRGKELGIAQQLLDTLIVSCREKNITDLYLGTVDRLHAALRFYERNGFRQINKSELPGSFPVMGADNVFCHLDLGH
ncbi:GNAT family N-acetyltransferase [Flavitalea flava]